MANELTITVSVAYSDANGVTDSVASTGVTQSLSAPTYNKTPLLVTLAADVAIPLGGVTTPVLLVVKNLDATNFVSIKTGDGGTVISKVLPGKAALIPLPATITAPYARADTGDCRCEVFVA